MCCPLVSRRALRSCRLRRLAGTIYRRRGRDIGMKTFGASATLKELQKKCGFEPDHVAVAAKELLGKTEASA